MKQPITFKPLILATLCASVLSACGGGGGGSNVNTNGTNTVPTKPAQPNNPVQPNNPAHPSKPVQPPLTEQQLTDKKAIAEKSGFGVVRNNVANTIQTAEVKIGSHVYTGKADDASKTYYVPLNINDFEQGMSEGKLSSTFKYANGSTVQTDSTYKVYNQPFSFVAGIYDNHAKIQSPTENNNDKYRIVYGGISPKVLPENNTFHYSGVAYNKGETGKLNYNITYTANNNGRGEGDITGLNQVGDIELRWSDIHTTNGHQHPDLKTGNSGILPSFGIAGLAVRKKTGDEIGPYELGIYGTDASEIAGRIKSKHDLDNVMFIGKKQSAPNP